MTDAGSGVDVADREQVLKLFFTTREEISGASPGLAVACDIVNDVGGGARFVVSLPHLRKAGGR